MRVLLTSILCLLPLVGFAAKTSQQTIDKIVAVVNDEVITQSEFNQQYSAVKNEMMARDAQLPSEPALKKQVLSRLMDISIQLQMAKDNGIKIDDSSLDKAVDNIAKQNQLNRQQLREQIELQGMTFAQYRENIRKQLIISQLQQQLVASKVQISDDEVKQFLSKHDADESRFNSYHVQDILLALPEEPTSAQIQATKQRAKKLVKALSGGKDFSTAALATSENDEALHGGDLGWRKASELPAVFLRPIKIMKQGEVRGPIRTDNGFHIIKLVEKRNNKAKHIAKYYHVRHILVRKDALTTDHEIKQKLNKFRSRILKGEAFGKLAKLYSDDFSTTSDGGDLGWVGPGKTEASFTAQMQALAPKQISKPFKTSYGWHIIEVLGTKTQDDSRLVEENKARDILFRQKFQSELQAWLQAIRGAAYTKEIARV